MFYLIQELEILYTYSILINTVPFSHGHSAALAPPVESGHGAVPAAPVLLAPLPGHLFKTFASSRSFYSKGHLFEGHLFAYLKLWLLQGASI